MLISLYFYQLFKMPEPINYAKKRLDDAYNNLYKNANTGNNNSKNSNTKIDNSYINLHNIQYSHYYNEVSVIDNKYSNTSK